MLLYCIPAKFAFLSEEYFQTILRNMRWANLGLFYGDNMINSYPRDGTHYPLTVCPTQDCPGVLNWLWCSLKAETENQLTVGPSSGTALESQTVPVQTSGLRPTINWFSVSAPGLHWSHLETLLWSWGWGWINQLTVSLSCCTALESWISFGTVLGMRPRPHPPMQVRTVCDTTNFFLVPQTAHLAH